MPRRKTKYRTLEDYYIAINLGDEEPLDNMQERFENATAWAHNESINWINRKAKQYLDGEISLREWLGDSTDTRFRKER